jgi:uncharacterized phage infection (PIP) family protein YhgE
MVKLPVGLIAALLLSGCNYASHDPVTRVTDDQNAVNAQSEKVTRPAQPLTPVKQKLAPATPTKATDIATLHDQLNALVQDQSCDTSAQCRVIGVGSRACGGPNSYAIYSSKTASPAQVEALAKQITEQERAYNKKNSMVSICEHLTLPSTQCVENKCVKLSNNAQATY